MLFIELLVNKNLIQAETELAQATSDNLIELCRKYLLLLTEFREELAKLREIPEINFHPSTSRLARELTEQVRKAIRGTVEIATRERNQTESLLNSLTFINAFEAVKTFNHLKYKGTDKWESASTGVRSKDYKDGQLMTIQEAVETAGLLRREAYITQKVIF